MMYWSIAPVSEVFHDVLEDDLWLNLPGAAPTPFPLPSDRGNDAVPDLGLLAPSACMEIRVDLADDMHE